MTQKYNIIHDLGRPLCLVGHSKLSKAIYPELIKDRETIVVSVEDLDEHDQAWYDQYQFIVASSDVAFKETVVQQLEEHHVHFFSIVHSSNVFFESTIIGQGCFVSALNATMPGDHVVIGNHCVFGTHCLLGHECIIDDFSHVSSFGYLGSCHLARGTVIGLRVSVIGAAHHVSDVLKIPKYSNIMSDSRITKTLLESGTYFGNRLLNHSTSRQTRIL